MYEDVLHLLLGYADTVARRQWFGRDSVCDWYVREVNSYFEVLSEMRYAMKGKKTTKPDFQHGFRFVNIRIGKSQRKEVEAWIDECKDDLPRILTPFLDDGYKFSLRRDDENETYIGAMTCVTEGHPNNNACLTSRSNDWVEALMLCLYKTTVLCENGVWPHEEKFDDWG